MNYWLRIEEEGRSIMARLSVPPARLSPAVVMLTHLQVPRFLSLTTTKLVEISGLLAIPEAAVWIISGVGAST